MHRAGAAMPVAALDRTRIGLNKPKCGKRQAQHVRRDLWEAGLVALAVRLGPKHECDAAVGLETDLGAFARRAARRLEKAGDTEPAQSTPRGRGSSPSGKPVLQQPLRHLIVRTDASRDAVDD
jgi:hypothetical protein